MLTEKVLYCAQVKATVGRDTRAVSSDGVLDLTVTRPGQLCGQLPGSHEARCRTRKRYPPKEHRG
jgi:organic hydroperoxide reductase OsmC/OhrA